MKIEVHLLGGTRRIIEIDPNATNGAVVGTNLFRPDGSIITMDDLFPDSGESPALSITDWSLILNIPVNVLALAATTTQGIYVITGDGTSATRTIEGTADEIDVADGNGVAGNPQVGLATLADAGGGTFRLIVRDSKGRISGSSAGAADDVPYDNADSGLSATDVQGAIDEIAGGGGGGGCCEILVADGFSAPPVMLTNEAEDDFVYSD